MRSSIIKAGVVAIAAAIALAACAGHGIVPSSTTGFAPTTLGGDMSPLALKTCATSPPQFDWIFKGACDGFTLKSTGGSFSLGEYEDITITGSIGKNTVKGSATVDLADAINKNGDITTYKGKTFPAYKAKGTTVVYAVANNQTTQIIKPIPVKDKPILEYVITDAKGLPGKTCAAALLEKEKTGAYEWKPFTQTYPVKGKTVTVDVSEAPSGFELLPKGNPLYFGVNCYT
jgi:hypothetical protein